MHVQTNDQNKDYNGNAINTEKEDNNNPPSDKADKNAQKNEESIVDKYLFFVYAIVFIILIYYDVNITLNNNCYSSLKSLFNLKGKTTSKQVSLNDMIPTIADSINVLSANNYVLQVFFFNFRKNFKLFRKYV